MKREELNVVSSAWGWWSTERKELKELHEMTDVYDEE